MTIKLKIRQENHWVEYPVYNSCVVDERLDEQFDSGEIQTITDNATSFEDFCMVCVAFEDEQGARKDFYYLGTDTVGKRGENYYMHTLELCEPTRLLMGILIDGRKVTQPVDGSSKKTLLQVLQALLKTFHVSTVEGAKNPPFMIKLNEKSATLFGCVSPEFYWEGQTQMWEALCDIGSVVDCIPRLLINDEKTAYNVITFDKINDVTAEYEM